MLRSKSQSPGADGATDLAEPATTRDKIDKEALSPGTVLAGHQPGQLGARRPPRQRSDARAGAYQRFRPATPAGGAARVAPPLTNTRLTPPRAQAGGLGAAGRVS